MARLGPSIIKISFIVRIEVPELHIHGRGQVVLVPEKFLSRADEDTPRILQYNFKSGLQEFKSKYRTARLGGDVARGQKRQILVS